MSRVPPPDCPPEQPIAALIPAALPRPRLVPAPVGDLPPMPAGVHHAVLAADASSPVFAIAQLNPSGQISAATVLSTLGWTPGDHIAFTVRHGAIVVTRSDHGPRRIGAGGSLVPPVAARRMCAIPARSPVCIVALPEPNLLVIHPIATIARLLARRHAQILEGPS